MRVCVCACVGACARVRCLFLCSNSCLTCQLAIELRFQLDLMMCQLELLFAVISDAKIGINILTHTHIYTRI